VLFVLQAPVLLVLQVDELLVIQATGLLVHQALGRLVNEAPEPTQPTHRCLINIRRRSPFRCERNGT
jgi:hypothetical protein